MNPDSPEDEAAFVALITEHQLPIRFYVRSLMPGDSLSDDIAQRVNATLWKKRSDFELGTHFKAWAFSVARFEVLTHRKKQARESRRLVFSEELEEVFAQELPAEETDFDTRQDALRVCLDQLREVDRELILHRYFRKEPLEQFAEKHDRSAGALRVALHRIRNRLQKCIEGQVPRPANS